jgi:hypothetical protein
MARVESSSCWTTAPSSQTGEDTLRTRVGQHFDVHFPVRSRGRLTADWPGRDRAFTCELEFAGQQMLKTLIVHDQPDEVDAFDTNL